MKTVYCTLAVFPDGHSDPIACFTTEKKAQRQVVLLDRAAETAGITHFYVELNLY